MEKHRDEIEAFAVDYSARLNAGDTLTGTPIVRVHTKQGSDITAEFAITGIALETKRVVFTLGRAPSGAEQLAGKYDLYVRVITTEGEELVEIPEIRVMDQASII